MSGSPQRLTTSRSVEWAACPLLFHHSAEILTPSLTAMVAIKSSTQRFEQDVEADFYENSTTTTGHTGFPEFARSSHRSAGQLLFRERLTGEPGGSGGSARDHNGLHLQFQGWAGLEVSATGVRAPNGMASGEGQVPCGDIRAPGFRLHVHLVENQGEFPVRSRTSQHARKAEGYSRTSFLPWTSTIQLRPIWVTSDNGAPLKAICCTSVTAGFAAEYMPASRGRAGGAVRFPRPFKLARCAPLRPTDGQSYSRAARRGRLKDKDSAFYRVRSTAAVQMQNACS